MKVAVATLGCKVNQFDSALLAERLRSEGFTVVPFGEGADVCIINTCTVTARTDYQSRQLVRRARRYCPYAGIVVTGCYAQVAPAELAEMPGVAAVVGNAEKDALPGFLDRILDERGKIIVGDIRRCDSLPSGTADVFPGRTRAILKVQDGCDAFCTYCIVPFSRGRSRSLPPSDVLRQAARFAESGYREVVLTGIHLGSYGSDLEPPASLAGLLAGFDDIDGVERVRLSSIEPMEVTPELISRMASSEKLCRHLHVPLQSGDDRILKLMGRNYTGDQFRLLVKGLTEAVPDIAVGVDVMTGFPGEGEEEFRRTAALIEELPLAYLHVFPYSRRPGTPAADFPHQVPEEAKKRRAALLRSLGAKKRASFARRFIGKEVSVLVEGKAD
ncbi:MAG TPA: tRNA (N(6)-L-threonylcarbamoyladenosine(37)-C(2))-methylthiotransferase MtaB, partial [Syntrophales bacterium]|nr:tRNA (N(6)-L-threonylcarbamoyladenosine(37)-C(2))-methylthiotransferase MtaB [Syntrophales bacterium]